MAAGAPSGRALEEWTVTAWTRIDIGPLDRHWQWHWQWHSAALSLWHWQPQCEPSRVGRKEEPEKNNDPEEDSSKASRALRTAGSLGGSLAASLAPFLRASDGANRFVGLQ